MGNNNLRSTLYRAATSASKTKETYLSAQYHRIAALREKGRAYIAVAHSIAVSIYFMLEMKHMLIQVLTISMSKKENRSLTAP